jgi:hypothetical protein
VSDRRHYCVGQRRPVNGRLLLSRRCQGGSVPAVPSLVARTFKGHLRTLAQPSVSVLGAFLGWFDKVFDKCSVHTPLGQHLPVRPTRAADEDGAEIASLGVCRLYGFRPTPNRGPALKARTRSAEWTHGLIMCREVAVTADPQESVEGHCRTLAQPSGRPRFRAIRPYGHGTSGNGSTAEPSSM